VDLDPRGNAGKRVEEIARLAVSTAKYFDRDLKKELVDFPTIDLESRYFKSSLPCLQSLKKNVERVSKILIIRRYRIFSFSRLTGKQDKARIVW